MPVTSPDQNPTPPSNVRAKFYDHLKKSEYWYNKAEAISDEYIRRVGTIYPNEKVAYIAAQSDVRWREAVNKQQFNERLANMYGQAAVLDMISATLSEQRKTNSTLVALYHQGGDPRS